jgi:hypothetical protein
MRPRPCLRLADPASASNLTFGTAGEPTAASNRGIDNAEPEGALWLVCGSQAGRGDRTAVVASAAELLALGEEHEHPQSRANALISLGWALGQSGDTATLPSARCILFRNAGLHRRIALAKGPLLPNPSGPWPAAVSRS